MACGSWTFQSSTNLFPQSAIKEMMQPCLINLHVISLVACLWVRFKPVHHVVGHLPGGKEHGGYGRPSTFCVYKQVHSEVPALCGGPAAR